MRDTSHLAALVSRLAHEKARLASSKTAQEKELRTVWVLQIEKEIKGERSSLGMPEEEEITMSDDELLAELLG